MTLYTHPSIHFIHIHTRRERYYIRSRMSVCIGRGALASLYCVLNSNDCSEKTINKRARRSRERNMDMDMVMHARQGVCSHWISIFIHFYEYERNEKKMKRKKMWSFVEHYHNIDCDCSVSMLYQLQKNIWDVNSM